MQTLTQAELDYNNVVLLLIEIFKVVGIILGIGLAYLANKNAKAAVAGAHASVAASEKNATALADTQVKVDAIKKQTDGITSTLVEATRQMGEAQATVARYEGKEEERAHAKEEAAIVAKTALEAVAVAAAAVPPGAVLVSDISQLQHPVTNGNPTPEDPAP